MIPTTVPYRDKIADTLGRALYAFGILPQKTTWQELTGGRVNRVWRVTADNLDIVCKYYVRLQQNHPAYILFDNDPQTEFTIIKNQHTRTFTPDPIGLWQMGNQYALLYHYIKGETWHDSHPHSIEKIACVLSKVHSTPIPDNLVAYRINSQTLLHDADTFVHASGGISQDMLRIRPAKDHQFIEGWDYPVLIHRDLTPGNIICKDGLFTFIDWQCAGYGDPCEDLAMFLSPVMHSVYGRKSINSAQKIRFLKHYPDANIVERYLCLAHYLHYRIAAYASWQVALGKSIYAKGLAAEVAYIKDIMALKI